MRRIALINQKGGVGKTTSSVNLGAALARAGRSVVLIDLDPQANLSMHLDVQLKSGEPSIYSVLLGDTPIERALRETTTPNLRLIGSCIDLSGAELELANSYGREMVLRDALDAWEKEHRERRGEAPADYVLLDCPPSLGLLAINGLVAAGEAVIVVQTEFFALQGMTKLVDVVQLLRRRLNPRLEITGILPCLYDNRTKLAREVLGELRAYFPGKVFQRAVAKNVKLAEAPSYGRTIFEYAPGSGAALDYELVAQEVLEQEVRDPELASRPRSHAVDNNAPSHAVVIVPAAVAERDASPRARRAPQAVDAAPVEAGSCEPPAAPDAVPENVPDSARGRATSLEGESSAIARGPLEPAGAEPAAGLAMAATTATLPSTFETGRESAAFEDEGVGPRLREVVLEPVRAVPPPLGLAVRAQGIDRLALGAAREDEPLDEDDPVDETGSVNEVVSVNEAVSVNEVVSVNEIVSRNEVVSIVAVSLSVEEHLSGTLSAGEIGSRSETIDRIEDLPDLPADAILLGRLEE